LIYSLRYYLRSILYSGNSVTCFICGGHFRKFLPYRRRKNVRCPRCNSFDRHGLLWMFLKNETNIFSDNLKILHFAPENIFQKIFKSMPNIDYIAVDINSSLVDIKADITNISFKSNSFDVILCVHVLEHVLKDQDAMRELFRVLKPGGWAIIQSPVNLKYEKTFEDQTILSPKDRERVFGQIDHVRIYGQDYKERLEKAGFTVKVDGFVRDLGIDIIKKYGLLEDEDIYICIK